MCRAEWKRDMSALVNGVWGSIGPIAVSYIEHAYAQIEDGGGVFKVVAQEITL